MNIVKRCIDYFSLHTTWILIEFWRLDPGCSTSSPGPRSAPAYWYLFYSLETRKLEKIFHKKR
jgi:hypothetical protein